MWQELDVFKDVYETSVFRRRVGAFRVAVFGRDSDLSRKKQVC